MKKKDITGQTFGRIKVIRFLFRKNAHSFWDCICECGNKLVATNNNLSTGHTKSCGCLRAELMSKNMSTHKMSKSRFWTIFVTMQARCKNTTDLRYGGRGIKCLWQTFEDFRDDMYPSYLDHVGKHGEKQTTIERIDNHGNYQKENCKWATWKEQNRNRRSSTFIVFRGDRKTIAEWSEITGIGASTICYRLYKAKWGVEKILTEKVRK